jgi:histidine triad (HIT) family protein
MTEPCIFCQIIRHQAPYSGIYEDQTAIAFLSNHPVNPGHTLIVPKKHYENIYEVPDEEIAQIFKVSKKIAVAVNKAVNADGIRIVQNNGEAAGQVIAHFHVHVIPMHTRQLMQHHVESREAAALQEDAEKIKQFI